MGISIFKKLISVIFLSFLLLFSKISAIINYVIRNFVDLFGSYHIVRNNGVGMMELADVLDSKSSAVMNMPSFSNGLFMRFPEYSCAGAKSWFVIFGGKAQKT